MTPEDVERALYDDRSLVRVLAMRRTLWVVPRELLPVVLAAATRTVAERERRRLEGFVRDSGISTRPATWLARAEREGLAAVEARGEAFTRDITRAVPLLATKLRVGSGRIANQHAMLGRDHRADARYHRFRQLEYVA